MTVQNFDGKEEIFVRIIELAVKQLDEFLLGKEGDWKHLLGEVINNTRINLVGSICLEKLSTTQG